MVFRIVFVLSIIIILASGILLTYCVHNLVDIGVILIIAGIFGCVILLFLLHPVQVEARSPYQMRGAGISQQMNIYLYRAVNYDEPPEVYEDDIDLLARLITSEFGYSNSYSTEDYERGCYLTGSVVINRMKHLRYPNTLQEVIYQCDPILQYQCTVNGQIERPYDEIAWEIAEELLLYGTDVDESVIYQANFKQGSGVYEQIGRTYFCYE